MAYTPYEWTVNSYLNPTRMNAIEQGIAAASQAAESASGEFHTIEELIGTQSIAGIGDGTLTGATWKINNDLSDLKNTVTTLNSNLHPTKEMITLPHIGNNYVVGINAPTGAIGGRITRIVPLGIAGFNCDIALDSFQSEGCTGFNANVSSLSESDRAKLSQYSCVAIITWIY